MARPAESLTSATAPPAPPSAPASGRLTSGQRAFFFLLLPILLSFPQGWSQAGPRFQLPMSLLWWAVTWLVSWWTFEAGSRLVAIGLRPWRPPLWIVLLLGALAGGLLSRWYTVPLFNLMTLIEAPPIAPQFRATPRSLTDPAYVLVLLQAIVSGMTAWLVANLVLEKVTGVVRFADSTAPRARRAPPVELGASRSPQPTDPPPRFLQRMTRAQGVRFEELLAVEAADHYIRVQTTRGTELVYYRFTDALEDLRGRDGLQVHRSFWIPRHAIERVDSGARQWELVLRNGARVPVSRANQGAVRLLGLR